MNPSIFSVVALASLLGCAGAPLTGSPTDMAPPSAMVTVADHAAVKTPSCDEPPKAERPAIKPTHLGMCTE